MNKESGYRIIANRGRTYIYRDSYTEPGLIAEINALYLPALSIPHMPYPSPVYLHA